MTKKESLEIRDRRDKYIDQFTKRITKKFPEAEFKVSRGPGLKRAWIYVRNIDTDNFFEITEPLRPIRNRSIDDGFFFYFLPAD